MRSVGNVGSGSALTSYQGTGSVSASGALSGQSSAAAFQRTASVPTGLSASRSGHIGLASPSLSSQTTSALMQEQDIAQPQGHGGGHGGGMKMVSNLEAEEAAGAEETQQTRKRKKLVKAGQLEDAKETTGLDENGEPMKPDSEQTKTNRADKEDRDIWSWL